MGTSSEPYLIAGYRLKYKEISKLFDDNYEKMDKLQFPWCGRKAKGTMGILMDGMGSDYVLAGYCIDCGEDFDGLSLNEIDQLSFDYYQRDAWEWLKANDLTKYTEQGIFKIFAVTHYH
jgi:hypothetical protein